MIYTSENNWYSWQYNLVPFSRKEHNQEFITNFTFPEHNKFGSFKLELSKAAASTIEHFPDLTPTILFSGGLDSELMLRAYLELGVVPDVCIFRYENDYNIYDVSYAVTVCSALDVKYKIVNFNLKKFYENDAERVSELSQIDRPRALPYCKFLEMVDGLPLLGSSDLSIARLNDDYTKQGEWVVRCWEHDVGWSKFIREINRPAVAEWFKWTPGLVQSFLNLRWCKSLINDEFYGKLGTNSTKIMGYREAYPELITRVKKTGFEKYPVDLMDEFENHLNKKYNGLPYRSYYDRPVDNLYNML
jgi:hypothetical protein